GDPVGGEGHIAQQHTTVDGEIIHPLFRLLHQGVAVDVPGQVLGNAADFFQGLVDGHCAHGYRRIADDPLAGLVDVFPGGQIHHGVGTPADAPGQLGDLFLNGGAEGRVADVAIDLDQKVAADNHRLARSEEHTSELQSRE